MTRKENIGYFGHVLLVLMWGGSPPECLAPCNSLTCCVLSKRLITHPRADFTLKSLKWETGCGVHPLTDSVIQSMSCSFLRHQCAPSGWTSTAKVLLGQPDTYPKWWLVYLSKATPRNFALYCSYKRLPLCCENQQLCLALIVSRSIPYKEEAAFNMR